MDPKLLARKKEITARLIESVTEYYEVFGKPISVAILSAKYSRALQLFGGFPRFLDELKTLGLVQVSLRESGGKDVWPGKAKAKVGDTSRMLPK